MNYPQLTAAIQAWANSAEIEQFIPTFVELTEADLNRRIAEAGVSSGEGRAKMILSAGAEYVSAPDEMLRVIRMIRGDGRVIENVTAPSLEVLKAGGSVRPGPPRFFTLIGSDFRYHPIPGAACSVTLTYERKLEPLTSTNATNWLIGAHPDTYLFGALSKAADFKSDEAAAQRFEVLYERAVATLIAADRSRRGDQRAASYRPDLPLSSVACGPISAFEN